jgi:hypothetical protein
MADRYTYVSPGVYRDTVTKQLIRSATNPNRTATKPASTTSTRPVATAPKPTVAIPTTAKPSSGTVLPTPVQAPAPTSTSAFSNMANEIAAQTPVASAPRQPTAQEIQQAQVHGITPAQYVEKIDASRERRRESGELPPLQANPAPTPPAPAPQTGGAVAPRQPTAQEIQQAKVHGITPAEYVAKIDASRERRRASGELPPKEPAASGGSTGGTSSNGGSGSNGGTGAGGDIFDGSYSLSGDKIETKLEQDRQGRITDARDQNRFMNPNVNNPFGGQRVTQNADGTVDIQQNLSTEMQGILDRGEGLTQMGQELAAQRLQGYKPFQMGADTVADRARIEDEVYNRLTKNTDADFARRKEQMDQTLYNRGININDPSDPVYKQNMQALSDEFNGIRADARSQAVQLGGQEYTRSYGIGLGQHQQNLNDANQLQQQGVGLQLPQFQGYQAPSMQPGTSTSAMDLAYKTLAEQQRQANMQNQTQLKLGNRTGAASTQQPQDESPFATG